MTLSKEAFLMVEEIKWRCNLIEYVLKLRDQFSGVINMCPKFSTQDFMMNDKDKMDELLKENSSVMENLIKDIDKMMPDLVSLYKNGYQRTDAIGFTVETEDEYEEDEEEEDRTIGFKVRPVVA